MWKLFAAVAAIVGGLFYVTSALNEQPSSEVGFQSIKIDQCLDLGGCWDYQAGLCRKHEENAQALCDASYNTALKTCECLSEKRDPWLCGLSTEPVPFDTPNRDEILEVLLEGAKIGLQCGELH